MSENDDEWDSEASYSTKCNTISKLTNNIFRYIIPYGKDSIRFELL